MFDVLDVYLWLSYRFPSSFVEAELVRQQQRKLDQLFRESMTSITLLLGAKQKSGTFATDVAAAMSGEEAEVEDGSTSAAEHSKSRLTSKLNTMTKEGSAEKVIAFYYLEIIEGRKEGNEEGKKDERGKKNRGRKERKYENRKERRKERKNE